MAVKRHMTVSGAYFFLFFVLDVRFFTEGTLFRFGLGFVTVDAFLEFGLQHIFDERSSFDEEKVIEIVEGLSVGGVVGDLVALGEEDVEAFDEKITNGGGGGEDFIGYFLVKMAETVILPIPPFFDTPLDKGCIKSRSARLGDLC